MLSPSHAIGAVLGLSFYLAFRISARKEANNFNLKCANLTQVQAIGTDFINAYLTGACLEAWNIDSKTQLEGVDCQYVYLLEQPDSKGNRNRRPHDHDKLFQPGDFEKLYKKIVDTVQILLRNGINQKAYQVALHELRKENPEITLDSIKVIDEIDKEVLITIKVPEETDKGGVQRIKSV
ncbi:pentapeptide repeat-containing protein [Coleofasciculus sp.]|uniref:pentapeptide repeat-containing protein n=1 Tax=Coleofasciculus sp. TaxID=3100458 RepID=UPI003A33EFFD